MKMFVPLTTLERYPDYLNYLRDLDYGETDTISSGAIASALGLGEVLVRKDLAFTESVGKPRVGYVIKELIAALQGALRCDVEKNAVIVGAGGLGRALLAYGGFDKYGINMVAGFDCDPEKQYDVCGKRVYPTEKLADVIAEYGAKLAIICVPSQAAQSVCDNLVAAGITGILTFAPVVLKVKESITVRQVDLAANLAILASMTE